MPTLSKQCEAIRRRSDVIRTLNQRQQPRTQSLRRRKCRLRQNMDKAGLQLRLNVPTDGNCLFHAISDQLKRLKLHRYRHGELREMAINQLRSQPIIVCSACVQTNQSVIIILFV